MDLFFYLFLEKHICIIPATSQCVASPCLESEGLVYSNFQSQFFFPFLLDAKQCPPLCVLSFSMLQMFSIADRSAGRSVWCPGSLTTKPCF